MWLLKNKFNLVYWMSIVRFDIDLASLKKILFSRTFSHRTWFRLSYALHGKFGLWPEHSTLKKIHYSISKKKHCKCIRVVLIFFWRATSSGCSSRQNEMPTITVHLQNTIRWHFVREFRNYTVFEHWRAQSLRYVSLLGVIIPVNHISHLLMHSFVDLSRRKDDVERI